MMPVSVEVKLPRVRRLFVDDEEYVCLGLGPER